MATPGLPKTLEAPGLAIGFSAFRSKTDEGVFGDIAFVMD